MNFFETFKFGLEVFEIRNSIRELLSIITLEFFKLLLHKFREHFISSIYRSFA